MWYDYHMGTEKHSAATKKQWAKLSVKQRQKRLEPLKGARWKKTTKKERSEHAKKMAEARWGIKNNK